MWSRGWGGRFAAPPLVEGTLSQSSGTLPRSAPSGPCRPLPRMMLRWGLGLWSEISTAPTAGARGEGLWSPRACRTLQTQSGAPVSFSRLAFLFPSSHDVLPPRQPPVQHHLRVLHGGGVPDDGRVQHVSHCLVRPCPGGSGRLWPCPRPLHSIFSDPTLAASARGLPVAQCLPQQGPRQAAPPVLTGPGPGRATGSRALQRLGPQWCGSLGGTGAGSQPGADRTRSWGQGHFPRTCPLGFLRQQGVFLCCGSWPYRLMALTQSSCSVWRRPYHTPPAAGPWSWSVGLGRLGTFP